MAVIHAGLVVVVASGCIGAARVGECGGGKNECCNCEEHAFHDDSPLVKLKNPPGAVALFALSVC